MTTNQEPLQNEEINSDYYLRYGKSIIGKSPERIDDDIVIFMSLLKEYSEKLLKLCDSRDRYRNNIKRYFLWLIVIGVSFIIIFMIISSPSFFWSDFLSLRGDKTAFIFIFTLLLISIGYCLIQEAKERLRLLEREMKIYALKLEKLIRITSPLHEHLLSDIAKKIKLDFRLTDAESALEHYKNTKKNRLLPF